MFTLGNWGWIPFLNLIFIFGGCLLYLISRIKGLKILYMYLIKSFVKWLNDYWKNNFYIMNRKQFINCYRSGLEILNAFSLRKKWYSQLDFIRSFKCYNSVVNWFVVQLETTNSAGSKNLNCPQTCNCFCYTSVLCIDFIIFLSVLQLKLHSS